MVITLKNDGIAEALILGKEPKREVLAAGGKLVRTGRIRRIRAADFAEERKALREEGTLN
jgi:hypothetical protein